MIDLRSLVPLDRETLLASVAKTGRAVVVHEAVRRGGVGAEIAALLGEELGTDLAAPVVRVAGPETPVPYARELEWAWLPNAEDVIQAVRRVLV